MYMYNPHIHTIYMHAHMYPHTHKLPPNHIRIHMYTQTSKTPVGVIQKFQYANAIEVNNLLDGSDHGISEVGGLCAAVEGEVREQEREGGWTGGLSTAVTLTQHTQC